MGKTLYEAKDRITKKRSKTGKGGEAGIWVNAICFRNYKEFGGNIRTRTVRRSDETDVPTRIFTDFLGENPRFQRNLCYPRAIF